MSDKDLWAMAAENLSRSDALPAVDLHGLAAYEAAPLLEEFLNRQFMAGQEAVRVICGIGSGKLMGEAKKILENYQARGVVENFVKVSGGGAYVVRLAENVVNGNL